ncbi:NADP-dependent oxidoreductase [Streptomyces sp. NBC_01016]|uniref:NADP-dependent oxidoreductase n=1 Tax=Streptomyces sp. NBC_01016 TaxID=2903720 RepID=UPI0022501997|nr:NADP-dependent oxidoreductase [Streptomyces sp. NBC_01016]MCX4832304.1 NADP-dependent oxidoreductase [Streptomyces sp. NBC_01016]MCX4835928.1 NADP-dependent oxidoreductase [Streptomyces sp. NBC_01016]
MTTHPTPTTVINRQVQLAATPVGTPRPHDFQLVRTDLPRTGPGQLLVRNTWMSVDPYMREAMKGVPYLPPLRPGDALYGAAAGEVVVSRAQTVPVGATVTHFSGWCDYAVVDAAGASVVDTAAAPVPAYLGVLGATGLTAYATLTEVAPVRPGDVVFVSAAAGAVGSVAGQIARELGAARVIGSAGGADKARTLVAELGFDEGLDHRAAPLCEQLAKVAPDGIDYYFDNVGGDHLEAAIGALRERGRIAMVGAVSTYNATEPPRGPANLFVLSSKNASLHGMLVGGYTHLHPEWIGRGTAWLAAGVLRTRQTVVEGLEQAPAALIGVLRGANTGKMLVRLAAAHPHREEA